MDQLLTSLPYLACPIAMGLMMWVMSRRGAARTASESTPTPPVMAASGRDEIAELRGELGCIQAEQTAIARQIDTLERAPAARDA